MTATTQVEGAEFVTPRASLLISLFYCAGFILVGGGFVLYTAGADPRVAREVAAASPLSQLLLGFFYFVGALLLLSNREARRILRLAWPILLLPGLAILSTLWSPDPQLTFRRATAFAGTIVFGLSLGAAYRYRDALSLVAVSMFIVMGLSIVLAMLDPLRAIHQPDDVIQAVHAGYWRGIFVHRNTLGFWAGASLLVLALAGGEVFRRKWVWGAAVSAAAVCLVATGSSAGLTIVALGGLFFAALVSVAMQPARLRGALAGFWMLMGLVGFLAFEEIARFALQLLGRESNLSGRTELWSYLLDLIRAADKPLGLGYFVGTLLLDQRLSSAMQMRNVNAHNGFLESYVYFGWPGVILAAGVAMWLVYGAIRFALKWTGHIGYLGVLPAVLIFMSLVHNLVESTIVSPNNLNNVLLAAVAAIIARARLSEVR